MTVKKVPGIFPPLRISLPPGSVLGRVSPSIGMAEVLDLSTFGGGGSSTLHGLSDVNVTEGSGIDGYTLNWDNGTSKWVATAAVNPGTQIKAYAYGADMPSSISETAAGYATLGMPLCVLDNVTLDYAWAYIYTPVNTHVYQLGFYPVNSSGVIQAGQKTAQFTWTTGASHIVPFDFTSSPMVLTAGTIYIVAVTDTSLTNGSTSISLAYTGSARNPYFRELPIDLTGQGLNMYKDYYLASLAPAATNTFSGHNTQQGYPWTLRRSA